ncbi:MAG: SMI1/KNR4 family protein [Polyangiales bacterium]
MTARVALSSAAKKRVFPDWGSTKGKRAAIDVAPTFAEMAKRWSRYGTSWKAGLANGDAAAASSIQRAESWMKSGPPVDADASALAAALAMFGVTLEYETQSMRDALVQAIAERCGPAIAIEAWTGAHAFTPTIDTGYYNHGTSKALWLRREPWPAQLIENYELPVWRFLRQRLADGTQEERAAAIAAGERIFAELDASDVSQTLRMAVAFAIPARPDWARSLVQVALDAWARPRESSALQALDVTPYALLASIDDLATANALLEKIVPTPVSWRFSQEYAETLVHRFGEESWKLLVMQLEPFFRERPIKSDGADVALKRLTEAVVAIESPHVVAFFDRHRERAMKSKVAKTVRTYLEKAGAAPDAPAAPTIEVPPPPPARVLPKNTPIADLLALAPPSRHFVPLEGLAAAEKALGTSLPGEYRAIVELYGAGAFLDFTRVAGPSWIVSEGMKVLEGERSLRARFPQQYPYPLWPEPGGLLPFGTTDNGNRLFFETKGAPDAWRVIVWAPRDEEHDVFPSLQAFLIGWMTWKKKVSTFPDLEGAFPWSDDDFETKPGAWFQPALRYGRTERSFDAPGTHAKRLAALKKALGACRAVGLRSREQKRQDHFFTDRDWRVTLTESDGSQLLLVEHPEDEAAFADAEAHRLIGAMGGRILR